MASEDVRETVVRFTSRRGETLSGTLCEPASSAAVSPGDEPRPAALLCHGYLSNQRYCNFPRLAAALAARGVSSLRFDHPLAYRGASESRQEFRLCNHDDETAEAAAGKRALEARGFRVVALLGHSKGGFNALLFAAKQQQDCELRAKQQQQQQQQQAGGAKGSGVCEAMSGAAAASGARMFSSPPLRGLPVPGLSSDPAFTVPPPYVPRIVCLSGRFRMLDGLRQRHGADILEQLESSPEIVSNESWGTWIKRRDDFLARAGIDVAAVAELAAKGPAELLFLHGLEDETVAPEESAWASSLTKGSKVRFVRGDHNFRKDQGANDMVEAAVAWIADGAAVKGFEGPKPRDEPKDGVQ